MHRRSIRPNFFGVVIIESRKAGHEAGLAKHGLTTAQAAGSDAAPPSCRRFVGIAGDACRVRLPLVFFKRHIASEISQRRSEPGIQQHLIQIRIVPLHRQHGQRILIEHPRRLAKQHGIAKTVKILPLFDPYVRERKPRHCDASAADPSFHHQPAGTFHLRGCRVQLQFDTHHRSLFADNNVQQLLTLGSFAVRWLPAGTVCQRIIRVELLKVCLG